GADAARTGSPSRGQEDRIRSGIRTRDECCGGERLPEAAISQRLDFERVECDSKVPPHLDGPSACGFGPCPGRRFRREERVSVGKYDNQNVEITAAEALRVQS